MENVPYLANPRLYERVVQKIRQYFDTNIAWLDYSYPIAIVGRTVDKDEEELTYPMVYKGDGSTEHYSLLPEWGKGSSVKSYCFFEMTDPTIMTDIEEGTEYNLSVIFYARLDLCYPAKAAYDYTAELIAEVIGHLKSITLDARIMSYDINPETMFTRYSEMEQLATQWAMKQGTAFKIDFTIHDMQDCYDEVS